MRAFFEWQFDANRLVVERNPKQAESFAGEKNKPETVLFFDDHCVRRSRFLIGVGFTVRRPRAFGAFGRGQKDC